MSERNTPYISQATADLAHTAMARAFATAKLLGGGIDLVVMRTPDDGGEPVALPPQRVLMKMAAREPTPTGLEVTAYSGADGEFQKEEPFDIRNDDRFRLPSPVPGVRGTAGKITVVLPSEMGVIRALFTLQA